MKYNIKAGLGFGGGEGAAEHRPLETWGVCFLFGGVLGAKVLGSLGLYVGAFSFFWGFRGKGFGEFGAIRVAGGF